MRRNVEVLQYMQSVEMQSQTLLQSGAYIWLKLGRHCVWDCGCFGTNVALS